MILLLFATSFLTVFCFICCCFRRHRRQAATAHSHTRQEDDKHRIEIEPGDTSVSSGSLHDLTVTTDQSVVVKPDRPRALSVTSDSIELEWTKPELQGAYNIINYSVYRRSVSDPPDHWIQYEVISDQQMSTLTVSELSECTPYYFKVRLECEMGVGVESDVSEPVFKKILIPSKPGKPKARIIKLRTI